MDPAEGSYVRAANGRYQASATVKQQVEDAQAKALRRQKTQALAELEEENPSLISLQAGDESEDEIVASYIGLEYQSFRPGSRPQRGVGAITATIPDGGRICISDKVAMAEFTVVSFSGYMCFGLASATYDARPTRGASGRLVPPRRSTATGSGLGYRCSPSAKMSSPEKNYYGQSIIPPGGFTPVHLFTSADGALWRDNRSWEWAGQDGMIVGDTIGLMLDRRWAQGIGTIVSAITCASTYNALTYPHTHLLVMFCIDRCV